MKLQRRKGQKGQSLVEYALVLVLVAVVAIGVLTVLGQATRRPVAVVAGSLGAQKNGVNSTGGKNNLYVNGLHAGQGKADCQMFSGQNVVYTWLTVSTDITLQDILISIDGTVSTQSGSDTGTFLFDTWLPPGHPCPGSMVLQAHDALVIVPIVPYVVP